MKRKVEEKVTSLPSPIPSPDINAPSPEPDNDFDLPEKGFDVCLVIDFFVIENIITTFDHQIFRLHIGFNR